MTKKSKPAEEVREKVRYSDEELQMFKELIQQKLRLAQAERVGAVVVAVGLVVAGDPRRRCHERLRERLSPTCPLDRCKDGGHVVVGAHRATCPSSMTTAVSEESSTRSTHTW